MSKLEQLINELCPDGVEYKALGKLGDFYSGLNGKSKDDFTNGNAKFITYMNVFSNLSLKTDVDDKVKIGENENQNTIQYGDVLFTGSSETPEECGMSSVLTSKTNENLYLNSFCFGFRFYDKDIIIPEFSKYVFRSTEIRKQIKRTASGVTRFNVSKKKMKKVIIPIPPIPVQEEIVRILDEFTELTAELTVELTARKQQYEYYKNQLFLQSNHVEMLPLEKMFPNIRNGFVGTVTSFFTDKENGIRYLKGTNIHNGVISDNDETYVTKEFHQKHLKTQLQADDILMVQSGHVGECAVVGEKYEGVNCHALIIMSNGGKCNSKYVAYYLHSVEGKKKLAAITTGGTVKHILASAMKKLVIPFPPIAEQQRIVDILDRFDKLCNDISEGLPAEIEARQKQYEYYRDKLLTFKKKEVIDNE